MPGPIDSLRFVHDALLAEAARIERVARGDLSADDAARLAEDVEWFALIMDRHTRGEEVGLFPALEARVPGVAAAYLHDHVAEKAHLAELLALAQRLAVGDGDAAEPLRRQATVLDANVQSHVAKENELVLPLVHEHFSPPEQGEMLQKLLGTIAPEEMARAVPWIVERQTPDAAEAYVRGMMAAMPPEGFARARAWIRDGVSAERLSDLQQRVPELGA